MRRRDRRVLALRGACRGRCAGSRLRAARGAAGSSSGHGFGHGVGMSQYGAYGYAQHGRSYKRILHHYYRHTTIGKAKATRIRVLLDLRGRVGRLQPAPSRACGQLVRRRTRLRASSRVGLEA